MVFVVGAVGIDVVAVRERFLDGTSNPSDIRGGLGGVGYRIFSNLDTPRRFLTALAADPVSRWAREALEADGDVVIQEVGGRDARPPLHLAVMESGGLKLAASDFRIVEPGLTLPFVQRAIGTPLADDFLVMDANLSPSLLAGLIDRYAGKMRVVFAPASGEEARRHREALRGIFLMTLAAGELESLTGGDPRQFMTDRSIPHIVATRGEAGVRLYGADAVTDLAPRKVIRAPDTTGAGDFLLACLLSSLSSGRDMPAAVRAAMDRVEQRLQSGGDS